MSKPKLKGETIGVRLPLLVDASVRSAALAAGITPSEWLTRRIVRLYAPDEGEPLQKQEIAADSGPIPASVTPMGPKREKKRVESNMSTVRHPSSACEHKNRAQLAGGMAKCVDCGRIRGANGSWR
jgi:hypothetical protein